MAWAAGNDNEVTTMELDASARAAEVGRFFPRAFFSSGAAGVAGSTEGGVCSVTDTRF